MFPVSRSGRGSSAGVSFEFRSHFGCWLLSAGGFAYAGYRGCSGAHFRKGSRLLGVYAAIK